MLFLCSPLRRRVAAGTAAWHRGELERAVRVLGEACQRWPGAPDPLLPLARARSESGELQGALEVLEQASARLPSGQAAALYRGLVLFDHGQLEEAGRIWEPLGGDNRLAAALLALIPLERSAGLPSSVRLPAGSRWFAEVAGRLAGTLETRYFAARLEAALGFDHALRAAEPPRTPFEQAFAGKRFAEVEKLYPGKDQADEDEQLQLAHALIAQGKEAAASRHVEACLKQDPGSAVRHFACGVAHARFGRVREARWSFVRAARRRDYLFDEFLMDLLAALEIALEPTGS